MAMLTEAEWKAKGYPQFIAEAFEDIGMDDEGVQHQQPDELLDAVLRWQGIHGYTSQITEAVAYLYGIQLGCYAPGRG
jgi:hypothetical protein